MCFNTFVQERVVGVFHHTHTREGGWCVSSHLSMRGCCVFIPFTQFEQLNSEVIQRGNCTN